MIYNVVKEISGRGASSLTLVARSTLIFPSSHSEPLLPLFSLIPNEYVKKGPQPQSLAAQNGQLGSGT